MVTFDFDAELVWLGIDASVRQRPTTLSIGEYGARCGVPRVLDVLERHGVRTSWMVPGQNAVTYPAIVRSITDAGHEIGNHGLMHENFGLLDRNDQRVVLERANELLESVSGQHPTGFRTPTGEVTSITTDLLLELGFRWSSFMRGDDRPYFVEVDGEPTELVEIPGHWELDDFPNFMFNDEPAFPAGQCRIACYSEVLDVWKAEFDAYYDLGLCYMIMFHPQTIGTPGRLPLLDELLAHIRGRPDVWIATGAEVADWWRSVGPPNDPGHPMQVLDRMAAR